MGKYYKPLKTEQIMVLVSLATARSEYDDKLAIAKIAGTHDKHKYPEIINGYTRGPLGIVKQPRYSWGWWQIIHISSGNAIETYIPHKRRAAVMLDCLLDSDVDWYTENFRDISFSAHALIQSAREYALRYEKIETADRPIPWSLNWRRSS